MNPAFQLFRLQQIDTQIDQAEAQLAEVNRLLSGDEAVRQATEAAENTGKALHKAREALKATEFNVSDQQTKIAQAESTLYSGRGRTPKELQDLQKDIISLKKHLSTLEDRQLEAMIATEEAESADQAAAEALTRAQANLAEKSAGWLGQKEQISHTLERLRAERGASLSLISASDLKAYDTMRKRKNGLAVVTSKENSCSACGASFRPSELQAARASQILTFCSSCGRILYAG